MDGVSPSKSYEEINGAQGEVLGTFAKPEDITEKYHCNSKTHLF